MPPELAARIAEAKRAFAGEDFPATVRLCEEVLRAQPDEPRALALLGAMAQRTGANDVAIGFFQRALKGDRRLGFAHLGLGDAHLAAGAIDAALTSYRTAIALEPRNAEAQSRLAAALLAAGEREKALTHFRRALVLDPGHRLAGYMVAGLSGTEGDAQSAYVRGVFDHYAPMFERHLIETLGYRMPEAIAAALAEAHPEPFAAALDLGCGTGLVADALGDKAPVIDGVDLSPKMIELATAKGRYRRLEVAELGEYLARPDVRMAGYDLVVAADVFIYVGALETVLPAVAAVLPTGGLLAFSVEHLEGERFGLQPSSRYAHSAPYIAALAEAADFVRLPDRTLPLRRENNNQIMGRIELLQKRS
jgi:predicted TPR repeat methyltransferase